MTSTYVNLVRGTYISNYLGLKMKEGHEFKYRSDYVTVEIPIIGFEKDGELVDKVLRNQYVKVIPACTVDVRGARYHAQVEPNPALAEFGLYQPGYYIHTGTGEQVPGFWFQARKDLSKEDVAFAIRLYLRT